MLSPLRNRFGIPGVISVVALVFAMLGGAYAAQDNGDGKATASAKAKRGPKGPKGATGPAGPAGPAGPQGAAGANGKDGFNGSNGATGAAGAAGTSVTSDTFEGTDEPDGEPCEEVGGVEFKSASPTAYACNGVDGEDGEPWTAGGTLPVGATETGTWAIDGYVKGKNQFFLFPMSFTVPLASELGEDDVHYVAFEEAVPTACQDPNHAGPASMGNPEATSGNLCVYSAQLTPGMDFFFIVTPEFIPGAAKSGAVGLFKSDMEEVNTFLMGSWAVTG